MIEGKFNQNSFRWSKSLPFREGGADETTSLSSCASVDLQLTRFLRSSHHINLIFHRQEGEAISSQLIIIKFAHPSKSNGFFNEVCNVSFSCEKSVKKTRLMSNFIKKHWVSWSELKSSRTKLDTDDVQFFQVQLSSFQSETVNSRITFPRL